jgi:organic radical activating enzyme
MKAPIYEIFVSYQGEGLYVGQKQVFVRFSSCNLRCKYCDEKAAMEKGAFLEDKTVFEKIAEFSKKEKNKIVSFTGGEPLLYPQFIKKLAINLKKRKFILHLETNGVLYENLIEVKKYLDYVSMDIKLPSQVNCDLFSKHKKFLKLAESKAAVKIVVLPETNFNEFKKAVFMVKDINSKIPFFIQPESSSFLKNRNLSLYNKFVKFSSSHLKDVRLSVQLHKILNIR